MSELLRAEDLQRVLAEYDRRLAALERSPQLGNSSIRDGNLTVINPDTGNPSVWLGDNDYFSGIRIDQDGDTEGICTHNVPDRIIAGSIAQSGDKLWIDCGNVLIGIGHRAYGQSYMFIQTQTGEQEVDFHWMSILADGTHESFVLDGDSIDEDPNTFDSVIPNQTDVYCRFRLREARRTWEGGCFISGLGTRATLWGNLFILEPAGGPEPIPQPFPGDASVYISEINALSPSIFWPVSEGTGTTIADISGNSRPATALGSPAAAWGSPGPLDQTYRLELTPANNNRVRQDSATAIFGSQGFAMAFFMRAVTPPPSYYTLAAAWTWNDQGQYLVGIYSDNRIGVRVRSIPNKQYTWNLGSIDLFDGDWHHVALTSNGGRQLWIDGTTLGNQGGTFDLWVGLTGNHPWALGAYSQGTTPEANRLPGSLALFSYWGSDVTIPTAAQLMAARTTALLPP